MTCNVFGGTLNLTQPELPTPPQHLNVCARHSYSVTFYQFMCYAD